MSVDRVMPASGYRRVVGRRGGWWLRFVYRYGWRAYAVPVLAVLTVAALLHTAPSSAAGGDTPAVRGAGPSGAGLSGAGPSGAGPSGAGLSGAGPSGAGPSGAPSSSGGRGVSGAAAGGRAAGVQVEGLTAGDAGFGAGSTPAPVVIDLGDDAASCTMNTYDQLVLVSVSKQHLWACHGGQQVNSTAVTTGATFDHDQTPLGSWRVQAKQRDRYLVGPGYRDYVHYWVPFNGDFGLHDAPWQSMAFGSKDYPRHGSHGCVHVPTAVMAWLYRWAGVGDTVVTVEA